MTDNRIADLQIPDPPRGIRAIPWRLPIWLYRLKLGRLLGHRFLLLNHIGRKSGHTRNAVLEVIYFDEVANTHYSASGFGEKSQWFQNISQTPEVVIQIGNEKIPAVAEQLPVNEAEAIFKDYHRRNPNAIKNLSKLVGYPMDDSKEDLTSFMRSIPVVAFRPRE